MAKLKLNHDAQIAWNEAKKCDCDDEDCHPNNHRLCYLCNRTMLKGSHASITSQKNSAYSWDIDHIIPRSIGGNNKQNNKKAVHVECNRKKGNKLLIL